jgi:hypothetical protein
LWEYVLSLAETNYNFLAYQFTHATGVCVGGTIITTAANPTSATDFGLTNLDAAITSRSTYAGGAVASVAGNVGGSVASVTNDVGITQAAADKAWNTAARLLTAGTNIALAKGVGLTGLNDIAATAIVSAGAITTAGGAVSTVTAVTNDVGITQGGADKVWSSAARTLTAFSTTLALSVWDVLTAAIAAANSIGVMLKTNLDATVSSRSTYAGTAVASVTAAVTVGTNNDKTGYALTSGERDSIAAALLDLANGVETGYTVKQALRVMAAVLVGKASGYPAGPGVFRNLGDTANRASVTNDADGNRTAASYTP